MHASAFEHGRLFFDTYVRRLGPVDLIDVGAMDVNGSLRDCAPDNVRYLGLDLAPGKGVDRVLDDPYRFPLPDASVDVAVSSSCFEHVPMYWLTFLEVLRVLKDGGLFYLNAPSRFAYHAFPVDCHRFMPDSGPALAAWGRRSGMDVTVLEHYSVDNLAPIVGPICDYVCVFLKLEGAVARHPERLLHRVQGVSHARLYPDLQTFIAAP